MFNHSLHKELWGWLMDNPTKEKFQWTRWKDNGGDVDMVDSFCFACEYTMHTKYHSHQSNCDNCPLKFEKHCNSEHSLFVQWNLEFNPEKRTRLAMKIRDTAVKDGVVCI